MGLVLKIAWRNILRHRGKSFIIGIILFLGALIMTLGNGAISGMDKGIQANIVERFIGHVVVIATNQADPNVLLTPGGESAMILTGYTNIRAVLARQDYVNQFLPVTRGAAMALSEDGPGGFTMLLGVKFLDYQRMFHTNLVFVEGHGIEANERGALVTAGSRDALYENTSHWLIPDESLLVRTNLSPQAKSNLSSLLVKSNIVLMGFANDGATLDVRVPVRGIFKYKTLNAMWKFINFIDLESFRECFNYITGADAAVEVPAEKKKLLSMDATDLDSLFEDNTTDAAAVTRGSGYDVSLLKQATKRSTKKIDLDAGAYNIIMVKFKDGTGIKDGIRKLNGAFRKAGTDGRAVSWKKAASQIGDLATIIRGILFGFVLFIYFVAIIIIMNTLSMNAIERTTEIGMMRAVGANKNFIAGMFVAETFLLSFVFGGAGMVLGAVIIKVVAAFHITSANEILQLLFGGDFFQPQIGLADILPGIVQLLIVTLLSVLYPVFVARRITPLEAISRD
jgi:ABC-type lipoprotein release transport system permease subunit